MTVSVVTQSPAETERIAAAAGQILEAGDIVVLIGDLGAGKTTFTRGLAAGLGVTSPVVSPTFTLVRTYEGRLPMVHADLYRLDRAQEVIDLGLEDVADERSVIVVEWGDIAARYLPGTERLEVRLERTAGHDDERCLSFTSSGSGWSRRAEAIRALCAGS